MAEKSNSFKLAQVQGKIDVSGMCHASCPFVGSKWDQSTPMGFPHEENRCYRHGEELERQLSFQRLYCLSEQYESCKIYQQKPKVLSQEPTPAARKHGLRLAIPVAAILLLLFALISAPIVRQNSGDDEGLKLVPDLDPVHALFQETPISGVSTDVELQPGTQDRGISHPGEAESLQAGDNGAALNEEPQSDPLSTGSGSFRAVPYASSE